MGQQFPSTHWSVFLRARSSPDDSLSMDRAREKLCANYWKPLYIFARSRGKSQEDAEDLVQSFIYRLLSGNSFLNFKPKQGSFRSFLRTSFQRFMVSDWRRGQAQKRGGDVLVVPIDRDLAEAEFANHSTSEDSVVAFDKQWARSLLARALKSLQATWGVGNRRKIFEVLKPFLTLEPEESLADIADRVGVKLETLRKNLSRLREDYRKSIRDAIAETLSPGEDIEEELQFLLSVLLKK